MDKFLEKGKKIRILHAFYFRVESMLNLVNVCCSMRFMCPCKKKKCVKWIQR